MPSMAYLNDYVYKRFLSYQYQEAVSLAQSQTESLKIIDPTQGFLKNGDKDDLDGAIQDKIKQHELSTWEKMKSLASITAITTKIKVFLAKVATIVEELTKQIVSLIIVFIISTIVLPIMYLWGVVHLFRILTGSNFGLSTERTMKNKILKGETAT